MTRKSFVKFCEGGCWLEIERFFFLKPLVNCTKNSFCTVSKKATFKFEFLLHQNYAFVKRILQMNRNTIKSLINWLDAINKILCKTMTWPWNILHACKYLSRVSLLAKSCNKSWFVFHNQSLFHTITRICCVFVQHHSDWITNCKLHPHNFQLNLYPIRLHIWCWWGW